MKFSLTPEAKRAGCKFKRPRKGDAGYDLYSAGDYFIPVGEQVLVKTGLTVEIPEQFVGIVKDRSGMTLKRIYYHAGLMDESYRGQWSIPMSNDGKTPRAIKRGDRFAQVIFVPYLWEETEEVPFKELSNTERGSDGFGSTGT